MMLVRTEKLVKRTPTNIFKNLCLITDYSTMLVYFRNYSDEEKKKGDLFGRELKMNGKLPTQ